MSVRFIIFGFNGNFALEKRLNIWKQKNFGVGQISDTTKDIESSRTIKSSKPQHFLCGKLLLWLGLRPICSFSITISSSSSPLFFFQMISSTSHGTNPLFFPLATLMKPPRSHSLLTQIWRGEAFSVKHFNLENTNTHSLPKNKSTLRVPKIIYINSNLVQAITACFCWDFFPGICLSAKQIQGNIER